MSAPWYRKPLCWAGMCNTFRTESDDTGQWGECAICHKRVGFVGRVTLRRIAAEEVCISPELAARLSPAPEIEPVGEVKVLNRRSKRRRAR